MAESIVLFFPDAERRQAMAARLASLGYAARVVDAVAAAALPGSAVLLTDDGDHLRPALTARADTAPILILAGDPRKSPAHCSCTVLPIPREPSDGELSVALAAATQMVRRQSEIRFRDLFEEAPLAYQSLDESGVLLDVNAAWTRLFGYSPAEAIGHHIGEFLTEASRSVLATEFPRFKASGAVAGVEMAILRKDGTIRRIEVTGSIGRDACGHFRRTHCILTDLTARHAALAALRESEEKFRLLFEHAPLGIGLALPDSKLIVDANPALCRMLGYSAEELAQKTLADITHPDDMAASQEGIANLQSGALPHYSVEKRFLHKDGHVVWTSAVGTAIRDAGGKLVYAMGIAQDISGLREAERLRTENLERQRDVLVREVHHRIKNNLQGVISLIEQLKRKQPAAADALEEAAVQVSTIAVVHGLHSRTLAAEVRPRQLVRAIADSVTRLTDSAIDSGESDATPGREWLLNARDTVAVALVINELIYNAIKHNGPDGTVEVRYGGESGAFGVRVFNRPARLPPGFDFAAGHGLGTGLGLIASLLPRQGARLAIRQFADGVEAHLQLSHPCASAMPVNNQETT
jgi:PAS domain S-box-containing protein